MVTLKTLVRARVPSSAAIRLESIRPRLLAVLLLLEIVPAHAIPPPPPQPRLLREAKMTVVVRLIETRNGITHEITELCKVSGKIPVYADEGRAYSFHTREIAGCKMPRMGKKLDVSVRGAKAMSKNSVTFATANVEVVGPDAVPLCSICGPQPLADSRAETRISGNPASISFNLIPNPISLLNAKPTVWLEADVEIVK